MYSYTNVVHKKMTQINRLRIYVKKNILRLLSQKSDVALTQLSVTLHYSRRIFYYQHYIHI